MIKRTIGVFLAATLISVGLGATSAGADTAPPNPYLVAQVTEIDGPVTTVSGTPPAPAGAASTAAAPMVNGCWSTWVEELGTDSIGQELFHLRLDKSWCGQGGATFTSDRVTSQSSTTQPYVTALGGLGGWNDNGEITTNSGDRFYMIANDPSHTAGHATWRTWKFRGCFFYGCYATAYPHVWINVHFDGWSQSGGSMPGTQQ